MAKKLKVGDVIRGYRITKVFGPGMMAISYAALAPGGRKVFFKQYKSPAPTVVWSGLRRLSEELSVRVVRGKADNFAVAQVDSFEEVGRRAVYFQAFRSSRTAPISAGGWTRSEAHGRPARRHQRSGDLGPARDGAKVLVAGIAALHEVKIVHADLKPPTPI